MSKLERNWQYTEQYPAETDAQMRARRLSLELGIEPISRAVSAYLSTLAVLNRAQAICEVGTGVGVSGLALMRYTTDATLTSIDVEREHMREARALFADAGIAASRLRLIEGNAQHVLPRLNHSAYDVVLLDAEPELILEYVEHALTIARPGGCIIVPNALSRGRVPDPAARDERTQNMRDLLAMVQESPSIASSLSPAGDGVLTITVLPSSEPTPADGERPQ